MGGYSGCNGYGGPYPVADKGRLSISELAGTTRGCLDQSVQQQETAYLQALQQAASYQVRDERLELMDANGEISLVFSLMPRQAMNPADLIGTQWVLRTLNGAALLVGSTITINFADGEAQGSAGCRQYASTYEAKGAGIRFTSTGIA